MSDLGAVILFGVALLCAVSAIVVVAVMWHQSRRPLTDTDRWCSELDQDLDRSHGRDPFGVQRGNPRGVGRQDWPL